ncbi:MAG TPA: hypothetical protein VMB84_20440 [Stellaceae bacterium]|nr:hypothetical protein [Stellaceae bacterium]
MPGNAGLSAAEAFILMSLPKFDARQALKLGFLGLLAQGLLRLESEERRGLIRTRRIVHLYAAPPVPEVVPGIAGALLTVVRAAEPDGLMKDVVKQSVREYGAHFIGFAQRQVLPALVARGLAEERRSRLLGLVPRSRHFRTPAGDREKLRLEQAMREARAIPRLIDGDPGQAVALVAALGGAILLVDELRPHYAALGQALRERGAAGGDGGGIDGGTLSFDPSVRNGGLVDPGGELGSIDLGSIDFGSIDFGAFDGGMFDSFDAGFADAGGDGGGGDGGGGDGGSSGC